jgi:hypothetical protein
LGIKEAQEKHNYFMEHSCITKLSVSQNYQRKENWNLLALIELLSHLTSSALFTFRSLRPPRLQCFPTPFLEIYPCNTFSDYCNFLTPLCLSLVFFFAAMAIRRSARIRRAQESPEVS